MSKTQKAAARLGALLLSVLLAISLCTPLAEVYAQSVDNEPTPVETVTDEQETPSQEAETPAPVEEQEEETPAPAQAPAEEPSAPAEEQEEENPAPEAPESDDNEEPAEAEDEVLSEEEELTDEVLVEAKMLAAPVYDASQPMEVSRKHRQIKTALRIALFLPISLPSASLPSAY